MLKICLVYWKSEPQQAYKRYAYKNMYNLLVTRIAHVFMIGLSLNSFPLFLLFHVISYGSVLKITFSHSEKKREFLMSKWWVE